MRRFSHSANTRVELKVEEKKKHGHKESNTAG